MRVEVELLDLFAVVEALERVGLGVMLMQDVEVQRLWPPIHHGLAGRGLAAVNHRAFANVVSVHIALLGLHKAGVRRP